MGIETMYSVNVSQVATVSFEGVISDIGSKDPLSFATVQLLHGDEVHSVLSKDNGVFSFPSVHPGDYILRITYVGYDRYEKILTFYTPLYRRNFRIDTGRGSCISMGEILRWKSRERR